MVARTLSRHITCGWGRVGVSQHWLSTNASVRSALYSYCLHSLRLAAGDPGAGGKSMGRCPTLPRSFNGGLQHPHLQAVPCWVMRRHFWWVKMWKARSIRGQTAHRAVPAWGWGLRCKGHHRCQANLLWRGFLPWQKAKQDLRAPFLQGCCGEPQHCPSWQPWHVSALGIARPMSVIGWRVACSCFKRLLPWFAKHAHQAGNKYYIWSDWKIIFFHCSLKNALHSRFHDIIERKR